MIPYSGLTKALFLVGVALGGTLKFASKNPDSFQIGSLTRLTQERDSKQEPHFQSSILSWAERGFYGVDNLYMKKGVEGNYPHGTQPTNLL